MFGSLIYTAGVFFSLVFVVVLVLLYHHLSACLCACLTRDILFQTSLAESEEKQKDLNNKVCLVSFFLLVVFFLVSFLDRLRRKVLYVTVLYICCYQYFGVFLMHA